MSLQQFLASLLAAVPPAWLVLPLLMLELNPLLAAANPGDHLVTME
jgi:hypothetical protein